MKIRIREIAQIQKSELPEFFLTVASELHSYESTDHLELIFCRGRLQDSLTSEELNEEGRRIIHNFLSGIPVTIEFILIY